MSKFLTKNKYKLLLVLVALLLVFPLTSCRFDSGSWYTKPYTTYSQEWVDLWNGGAGFWGTIFGWPVNLLSYPVAWLCSSIGKALGNSFFWGVFFTTIIVRTLAWPIYSKQNGMSLKMSLMQPEMAKIQKRYEGRKDPHSQQQMQQEMMKLYKKYKINPLGCFGTMILQFPIFMSMYEVVQRTNATKVTAINGAVGVVNAGKFALADTKVFGFFEMNTSFWNAVEVKDKIFAVVVALLFAGVTFLSQKLSQRPLSYQKKRPNPGNSQQQQQMKWMMLIMNVMFVFMSLSNTALAVYWLIGGIYQLGQSQVGRKINEINYARQQKKDNIII